MAEIKIRKIDSTVEKRILVGMIVSDEFLQEIQPSFNLEYFQNQYAKRVATWCGEFFDDYEKAPFNDIENIYTSRKADISSDESDLISDLLSEISERHKTQSFNVEYLLDQTLDYFKKRELEITSGNIQLLLEKGDVESAEREVLDFHKVSRVASKWVNPMLVEGSERAFSETKSIMNFKGDLGNFIKRASRGWLVGVSGGFKRGKTWFVDDWAFSGMLGFLNVAKFSLEMNEPQNRSRLYRKMTAYPDEGEQVIIPMFDCAANMYGRCQKRERIRDLALVSAQDEPIPTYDPTNPLHNSYQPCSVCRSNARQDYEFAIWRKLINKDDFFDEYSIKARLRAYEAMYKHYYRLMCYPRFGANLGDIKRDLDILERRENFVPDIIIVDYVDILKPERSGLGGIEKEDESWMALAALASERHCLVVTPTQVTRDGLDAANIKTQHMGRWIGKLGHIDAMYTINQSADEKRAGYTKIGCIEHRHMKFDEDRSCLLTQNLDIGQFCLDSWID